MAKIYPSSLYKLASTMTAILAAVFIEQLGVPKLDVNLGSGGGIQA